MSDTARLRLTWIDGRAHVLTPAEPVSIPTHAPDAKGMYGVVHYVATHASVATVEEVEAWSKQ